jgi:hypothetical protein
VEVNSHAVNVVKELLNAKIRSVGRVLDKEVVVDIDLPNLDAGDDENGAAVDSSSATKMAAQKEEQTAIHDVEHSSSAETGLEIALPPGGDHESIKSAGTRLSHAFVVKYREFLDNVI